MAATIFEAGFFVVCMCIAVATVLGWQADAVVVVSLALIAATDSAKKVLKRTKSYRP